MEYNFRPQWRPWFFQLRQSPTCARCGNHHRPSFCFASTKQCFNCRNIGHYARVCFNRAVREDQNSRNVTKPMTKSKSQKNRDSKRIKDYFEMKSLTRGLPFANLRDAAFRSCLDTTSVLKIELSDVKQKLSKEQKKIVSQAEEIKSLQEQLTSLQNVFVENENLRADVIRLTDSQKRQSVQPDVCPGHIQQIQNLESKLQGNVQFVFYIQQKYDEVITEKEQLTNENSILHFKTDEYFKQIQELEVKLNTCESEKLQLQSSLNQRTLFQNQNGPYNMQYGHYR